MSPELEQKIKNAQAMMDAGTPVMKALEENGVTYWQHYRYYNPNAITRKKTLKKKTGVKKAALPPAAVITKTVVKEKRVFAFFGDKESLKDALTAFSSE